MDERLLTPTYLLKVTLGLLGLGALVLAALGLSASALAPPLRYAALVALLVAACAIIPFVGYVYRRMDELHRSLHQKSCAASLPIIAALSAVLGILQANGIVPAISQFWMLGAVVGTWGINLMIADRRYR